MNRFSLRRYSIRQRMIAGAISFVMSICLLGAAGAFGMHRIQGMAEDFMQNAYGASEGLAQLHATMATTRRLEKDMIIQYERPEAVKAAWQEWLRQLGDVDKQARALQAKVSPEQAALLTTALSHLTAYRDLFTPVARQLEVMGYDSATTANRTSQKASARYIEAEKSLGQLEKSIRASVDGSLVEQRVLARNIQIGFGVTIAILLLISIPATLGNMRMIVRPLDEAKRWALAIAEGNLAQKIEAQGNDEIAELQRALARMQRGLSEMVGAVRNSSESIASATQEIAEGNLNLSHRTEHTAGNVQQTVTAVAEVTANVQQTAASAASAHALAQAASSGAAAGGQVVQQAVTSMQALSTASGRIVEIVGLIDSIAFQTNILALNAAVEAARAGEQGRGFAVVAAEVRSLAQRSAGAAKDIKALIQESVRAIEVGVGLVRTAGTSMVGIVSETQKVGTLIGEITESTRQQSHGIADISQSLGQIDGLTQQNAALVEESAAAAESLREQARLLAETVRRFQLLDFASAGAAPAPQAAHFAFERARPTLLRVA